MSNGNSFHHQHTNPPKERLSLTRTKKGPKDYIWILGSC